MGMSSCDFAHAPDVFRDFGKIRVTETYMLHDITDAVSPSRMMGGRDMVYRMVRVRDGNGSGYTDR